MHQIQQSVGGLAFILFSFIMLGCSSPIRSLSRLEGQWLNMDTTSTSRHTETWQILNDSLLYGFGLLTLGSDTMFQENLRISRIDGRWFYVAEVEENPMPVFFALDSINKKGFVATNPNHDFPKQIQYRFDKNHLHAEVSGDGKKLKFDFRNAG